MKNIYILLAICLFNSCDKSTKISISKVEGSPAYEEAKLTLKDSIYQEGDAYSLSFNVDDYTLGDCNIRQFYLLSSHGSHQPLPRHHTARSSIHHVRWRV